MAAGDRRSRRQWLAAIRRTRDCEAPPLHAESRHQSRTMFALLHAMCQGAVTTLDLGGTSWQLTNATMAQPVAATVPGQVHTDLLAAGVIDEPFNGTNDQEQRWVALADSRVARRRSAVARRRSAFSNPCSNVVTRAEVD